MFSRARLAFALLGLVVSAPAALGQFNKQWLEFTPRADAIKTPAGTVATYIINDLDEKDYAYGDLNKDGWTDLVIVRKEPFSTAGKRVSYLLMNESGTLVDRTTQYASDSSFPGDFGFNTPTNSRDAKIADVNGDGWLDVITCQTDLNTSSPQVPDPKYLTHPRIYINKGNDLSGNWLGLRFEETRIPQILTNGGIPGMLRLCDLSLGDIDNDGDLDIHFVDYDNVEIGGQVWTNESSSLDVNDRLLINDGNGFYTDQTTARIPIQIQTSAFGAANYLADMNGDGKVDIVKLSTLNSTPYMPTAVGIAYNGVGATSTGFFDTVHWTNNIIAPTVTSVYHLDVGDLNNDGKLDITTTDDGNDWYSFNTGNDAQGRVIWSGKKNFAWLSGSGDNAISGQSNRIVDLDNDGWNDAVNPSIDVDAFGCARYSFIFRNPGGTPGSTTIQLTEEKQQSGTSGWFGAKGMVRNDMFGWFDAAVFDIDNDGWKDMVVGKCSATGTVVWMNKPIGLSFYGTGTPGCSGTQRMSANKVPRIGYLDWAITTSNCPPNNLGLGLITNGQDLAGSDPFGIGVLLHVNLAAPEVYTFDMLSDASGKGSVTVGIPNNVAFIGLTYYAQSLWAWSAGPCVPSPYTLSSSNGMALTIQPANP